MPRIPEYRSRLPLPVEQEPRIPQGDPVGAALEKGGAQIADIGFKFLEKDMELKRQAELIDLSTKASLELHQLKTKTVTDPSFYQDPESAGNAFAEQTKALQEQYLSQIKDRQVATAFKGHFAKESIHHLSAIGDLAIKQRNALGEGQIRGSITELEALAERAETDEEAQRFLGQANAYRTAMQNRGLIKPEDKVKEDKAALDRVAAGRAKTLALTQPEVALAVFGGQGTPMSSVQPVEPGNIDLAKRPVVKNADGSISTVRSMGVNIDGKEILIPTVSPDGKILNEKEAVDLYKKTGQHLGKFNSPQEASTYAKDLHDAQAARYGGKYSLASRVNPAQAASFADLAQKRIEHKGNQARQDLTRQEKIDFDAQNLGAYQKLYQDFALHDPERADFAGAEQAIANPAIATTVYGFKSKDPAAQIREVSGMIETQKNRVKAARDDSLKQQHIKTNEQLLGAYNKKGLSPDLIVNSNLPPADQERWQKAVKAQAEEQDKTNPAVFNSEYSKILTGEIQQRSQIPLPGAGLSGKDVAFLHEAYAKEQDPSKSRYYTMLGDEFLRLFKGQDDLLAKKDEFLVVLAHDIKIKKLEGEDIYRHGRELMKEKGRSMVDGFMSIIPGTGEPWREPRKFEESSILTETSAGSGSAVLPVPLEIPEDRRAKYEGVLLKNKRPVTDANIRALYEQDQKRGVK